MSSTNFCEENPKESFSLLLWTVKPRINSENHSEGAISTTKTLTATRLCCKKSYRKPPWTNADFSCIQWRVIPRKSTNDRSRYRNYDAASGTIFRIRKCLQEENGNTICAWTESTDLILLAFKKIFLWWPSSLNIRILFKGREDSRANRQKNSGKKSAGKSIVEKQLFQYIIQYCAAHIGTGGVKIKKEPRQRDEYVYRIS